MPQAIEFFRSVPRWLLVRALSARYPSTATGSFSCVRLADLPPPPLPGPEWVRIKPSLAGVCGSDLSAIACKGSPYFSPFVSTPFVLGHELTGTVVETGSAVPGSWQCGTRVVLEPALSCEVRGIQPPCPPCARGHYAHCENILAGSIKGGIQTGYCNSTGGAWSAATLVAHHCQLHAVPESLSAEEAVIAEPLACAVHAAWKIPREEHLNVLVLGCGTIGLLTIFAYRALGGRARLMASAWHQPQIEAAGKLGAAEIFSGRDTESLYKWVLERTASRAPDNGPGLHRPEIGKPIVLGGADVVLDCVGSSQSIDDALRLARPRGQVILVGMPGIPKGVDWTSIWYKELRVQGAYAYGWEETSAGERVKTMQVALQLLAGQPGALKFLVNRRYPLAEYRAALAGAFNAGRNGAFKTVFEVTP